ncbi:hypothetical protein BaRGS_00005102 [Batillaria attramentaria]|uniref:Ubiquitin-like protease family profile domain-containing protein n=1 Tax=Batillaria attramentaria TaxID=370345 RepID=A0ABD0LWJ1_9CAEN
MYTMADHRLECMIMFACMFIAVADDPREATLTRKEGNKERRNSQNCGLYTVWAMSVLFPEKFERPERAMTEAEHKISLSLSSGYVGLAHHMSSQEFFSGRSCGQI